MPILLPHWSGLASIAGLTLGSAPNTCCFSYAVCVSDARPTYAWSAREGELLSTLLTGAHSVLVHVMVSDPILFVHVHVFIGS